MTTKITVDAHAGWPVKITALDTMSDGTTSEHVLATVAPGEQQTHHIHQGRRFLIEEMDREPPVVA